MIPAHRVYTESFFGGGAVFWAKEPAAVEIINDLDSRVVSFYRILKSEFDALKSELELTLHSRDTYYDALHVLERPYLFDDLKVAWAFWVGTNMGFGSKIGSWGYDRKGAMCKKLNGKLAGFGPHLVERLRSTQFESNYAPQIIRSRDCVDAFHYADPPYFNSNCGHYKGYTEADFRDLLDTLASIEGKFLLSSYPSEILQEFTARNGWQSREIEQTVAVSTRSAVKKKREVLTWNYPLCA